MFFRILRNDLTRKRVTNAILLVFISLAAIFVSGSVNTMITIASAQETFFDMADICDYYAIEAISPEGFRLADKASHFSSVKSLHKEELLYIQDRQIDCKLGDVITVSSAEDSSTVFFHDDNTPLQKVNQGEIYIPQKMIDADMMQLGQTVKITIGGTSVKLKAAGIVKDALFGSPQMGLYRTIISKQDMQKLCSDSESEIAKAELISFMTDDVTALKKEISKSGIRTSQLDKDILKIANIMNTIIAAMFFVVSLCLIIISFVVLNFTIKFTLSQEFREIGVMKAIGIQDNATENMYLAKYIFISAIGGIIGFFAGIPFGRIMQESAVKNMVVKEESNYAINLLCVIAVVLVVVLFCRRCVRALRKYTPVDAVRDGSSGESYSKKSPISLAKSRLNPKTFLALNDLMTNIKTFSVMAFTFIICLVLMIAVVNTVNTLQSDNIVTWMTMIKSDVFLVNTDETTDYIREDGRERLKERLKQIESILDRNNMSGRVSSQVGFSFTLENDDNNINMYVMQAVGAGTDEFTYLEGTAPQNKNEIALTAKSAEELGVKIGDRVILNDISGKRSFMVTALYQTMMNMGQGAIIHHDADISFTQNPSVYSMMIDFDDDISAKEKANRMERLKELFPEYDVYSGSEYIESLIHVSSMLKSAEMALLPILLAICIMVTVLIERSIIAKEKGEIAMLKATGFSDSFIVGRNMLRVVYVTVISTIIAMLLSEPVAQLTCGLGFKLMGAQSVVFEVHPLEVYVMYPMIMLGGTLIAVWLTAIGTRKIKASETAGIE